jgi:uncharacterized PurR-regulated membrane protein YhhQ (DUF165 family)
MKPRPQIRFLLHREAIEDADDLVEHPLREALRNTGLAISGAGAAGMILWFCLQTLYEEKDVRVFLSAEYRPAFLIMGGAFALIFAVFLAHSLLGMSIGRRRATRRVCAGIAATVLVGLAILAIVANICI